jgi:membrane fusion protein, multidrug efflux system
MKIKEIIKKMNKSFSKKAAAVILALGLVFVTGCKNKQNEELLKKNEAINQSVPVQVIQVGKKSLSDVRTYSGSLEGVEQANIVAKIGERVTAINAQVDQYVKEGQVIIKLDETGPSSQYLQAKANYDNAEKNLQRMKALLSAGAISQQQLDQTQTSYDVAKANFDAAKSTVFLTAPLNGVLTNINVNEGDWVNPGMTLATVAKIDEMIIKFYVNENEIGDLKVGNKVNVYSEFNSSIKVKGTITEVSRSASSDSRSFQVKAKFVNTKDHFFKPGMFVKINTVLSTTNDVIAIPNDAIMHTGDQDYVFVVNNGKSFQKNIKEGMTDNNYTEILSGLNVGDTLVEVGMNDLSNGTKVTIANK